MRATFSARWVRHGVLVLAIDFACAALPAAAPAQTPAAVIDTIKQLQSEVRGIQEHYKTEMRQLEKRHQSEMLKLQRQLDELKAAHVMPKAVPVSPGPSGAPPPTALSYVPTGPAAAPPPVAPMPARAEAKRGGFLGSGIELTLGGFLEGATIYRSRNETADISSAFNAIPFPNSPNYHLSEFHFSAHQSRLSLLAQGSVDAATALAAYVESDFQSAPASESSIESNSYSPRLRQAYAALDRSDLGLHLLGGQAWSLLTIFNHGLAPRQERIPLTIDGQFVPGFWWTRQPQLRVVQDLDRATSVGVSLENPQASVFSGPNPPLVPTTFGNPGGNHLNPLVQYSIDIAPDIVAKVAYDPDGWGHYEAYGIGRLFRSRAGFKNDTVWGGGGGAPGSTRSFQNSLSCRARSSPDTASAATGHRFCRTSRSSQPGFWRRSRKSRRWPGLSDIRPKPLISIFTPASRRLAVRPLRSPESRSVTETRSITTVAA